MIKRIVLLTGVFLLLLAAPATAQTGGTTGSVQGSVSDNGTITGNGDGFKPGTNVDWSIASTPTFLGTTVADGTGHATITAALPGDITAGTHTLTASGTGLNGGSLVLSTQVQVSQAAANAAAANAGVTPATSAAGGGSLARTGSDDSGLIKIGVLLVALGGGAVLVTRKRRAAHVTA
jgi:LPXTG-motif cell wall-anchored protein